MHWLAPLILLLHLLSPFAPAPAAQTGPAITDLGVTVKFGETLTFRVKVEPAGEVSEMMVLITPEGQSTVWQKIAVDQPDAAGALTAVVDARTIHVSPFSKIQYHYEASLTGGARVTSPVKTVEYNDDRFQWQSLNSGIFQIHWYGSDSTLGPEIANIAERGMQQSQTLLKASPPAPLRIYAYNTTHDLQAALQMTNQPWVAGHASPELGMILISIPTGPEKKLELERQIPHEIMHLAQYQVMGKSYAQQPVWLVEGMASLAELYPNPEYSRVLEATAKAQTLIPFANLCASFPRDAGAAFQSYAQSESFMRFLQRKYGAAGLRRLIDQYQNGLGCEEGVAAALGSSLGQLEYRWQQEVLGVNVGGLVLSNLSPYLLVGLLLLVTAGLALLPSRPRRPVPTPSADPARSE